MKFMKTLRRNKIRFPILAAAFAAAAVFFFARSPFLTPPEKAVSECLSEIEDLDSGSAAVLFPDSAGGAQGTSLSDIPEEGKEAVRLFFRNFSFRILGSTSEDAGASVRVEASNVDAAWLAAQIRRRQLAAAYASGTDAPAEASAADLFPIMKEILNADDLPTGKITETLSVSRNADGWHVNSDAALKRLLSGGLPDALKDPFLLKPEDVLSVYLSRYSFLSPEEWEKALSSSDLFKMASEKLAAPDETLFRKISELYSYSIGEVRTEGNVASVSVSITSVDMPEILAAYRKKLVSYARTAASISAGQDELSDVSSSLLDEAISEVKQSKTSSITVSLENDGNIWQITDTSGLTNALLGDIVSAAEAFAKEG